MSNLSTPKSILLSLAVTVLTVSASRQDTNFVRSSQYNLRGNQYGPSITHDNNTDEKNRDNLRLRGSMDSSQNQIRFAVRQRHDTHNRDNNKTRGESNPASHTNVSRKGTRVLKKDKSKRGKAMKAEKKKKNEKKNANPTAKNKSSRSIPSEKSIPFERDGLIEIEPQIIVTSHRPTMSPTLGSSVMDSYSQSIDQDVQQSDFEGFLPGPVLDDREGLLPIDNNFPLDEVRSFEEGFLPHPDDHSSDKIRTHNQDNILPAVKENYLDGFRPDPELDDRVVTLPETNNLPFDELRLHNQEGFLPQFSKYGSSESSQLQYTHSNSQDSSQTVRTNCSGDVELLTRDGAKSIMTTDPILDAIEITHQDTSTVTMNLYQMWENKPGYALDFFYYYFHEPGKHFWGNAKCYEKTWVPHSPSRRIDAIQIACNRSQPYAELEICLADNVSHATLVPSDLDYSSTDDKAVLPKMCQHSTSPTELSACYKLKISCVPRSEDHTC